MRIRHTAIAAVIVIGGLAAAASGGSSSSSGGNSSGGGSSSKNAVGIGTAAADGKFTFTVNTVQCGIPGVGDTANGLAVTLGVTAQGQFCKVNVTVANKGTEAQDLVSDNQYAFDDKGSKLSTSSDAEIYSSQDSVLFTNINPGNSVTGDLYYDIPTTATISKFEFHDSMFSDGVTVNNK